LLTTWDAFVDELWADAPRHGATLLAACFPRAYIDANRAEDDIDPALLAEPWPRPLATSDYSRRGMGLIRSLALPDVPMYRAPLPVSEIEHRIQNYYRPYRRTLEALLQARFESHGCVWHLNCHSMKSLGNRMNLDAGRSRPDIVVSDRDGTTADPAFTDWVARWFSTHGLRTQINNPYRGGDLVATFGRPAQRRHSLQIEINRALYLDEAAFTRTTGFAALRRTLDAFTASLADFARTRLAPSIS
jgi:N-formylglutamate deformylase